jgi:hypothetical protein
MAFALLWRPHGGSGMSLSLTEILGLEPQFRDWLLERSTEQRRREANAIARAHGR